MCKTLLAIDVGGSTSRAYLVDDQGRCLGRGHNRGGNPASTSPEQAAAAIISAVGAAVADAGAGPLEIAVVGADTDARRSLHRAALAASNAVVVAGEPGTDIPLFADRTEIDGRPAAYVCRDFVCELPVTDPEKLNSGKPTG